MRIYLYGKQVIRKHLAVIALLVLSAVTAMLLSSAPIAWAGPVQNPLQQTIPPMPTPTPPSCGPTEVTGGIIDVNTIWYLACSSLYNQLTFRVKFSCGSSNFTYCI